MTLALIPVKSLAKAKSRLAPILNPLDRRDLVIAMLERVVGQCVACERISHVCVVTSDREIAAIAETSGAIAIGEPDDAGLNRAATAGLQSARTFEIDQILILPADIPFLTQSELNQLLDDSNDHRRSVIAPCHKGKGTNALLIPAHAAFTPQFGEASFWRHFAQLSALNLKPRILRLPGIAADIDQSDDLAFFEDFAISLPPKSAFPDRSTQCRRG